MTQQHVHIVDAQPADQTDADSESESESESEAADADVGAAAARVRERAPSQYEQADEIDGPLASRYPRQTTRFLRAVTEEVEKRDLLDDGRLLDELDPDETDDVDRGDLLVFPDESILFLGSDPTARDSVPLFAFIVERHQPIPTPTTSQEALDLLRPAKIRDAFESDGPEPARQGEWWLLPSNKVPVGTAFRPGVDSRPYGPSPLGNHVPTKWGMTVTDSAFMDGIREAVPALPESVSTPPEVIEWVNRQHEKRPTPEYAPDWEVVRETAGEILVKGTLRHRENDHFVESIGDDQWHSAQTHDMDVYTGDDYVSRVRID